MRGIFKIPSGLALIAAMINRAAMGRRIDAGSKKLRPL
jgi:hypothetical protein